MVIPPSGSEPSFANKWARPKGVRSNNCYDYAFDDFRTNRKHKSVPGDRSGFSHDLGYDSCYPLKDRLLLDNPGNVYREHPKVPCKEGFYKTMMFVSSKKQRGEDYGDFHFYRQDKDVIYEVKDGDTVASVSRFLGVPVGDVLRSNKNSSKLAPGSKLLVQNANLFTHKLGWATGGLITDSCGKTIKDPRQACRKHAVDYDRFCGSYCVRKGGVKTGA
jgi:hypothetical protein